MSEASEKSIFLQAVDLPSGTLRAKFLDDVCAGNESLRRSIENLLNAHDRPDNLLDLPALDRPPKDAEHNPTTFLEAKQADNLAETMIGPYRLMEMIGEGGFGVVYVAEQQQPVKRRVAIKLIRPGMDTYEVIARFEAERQALAMMDHPGIARVFDAGLTEGKRPYFVMELVRGVPITDFCEQAGLTLVERLRLFVTVCLAVQHAHQKGVIHRDIKPSNVMVTMHDETPVVKVIDFGIAKAIDQSLTDKTIYTRFQSMIGTPLYMSPEQAEMSGLDIDTRSDIYSLGVLLYELLTGTTPVDRQRFETASFDEVRRIIRDEDPPVPSSRATTQRRLRSTQVSRRGRSAVGEPVSFSTDLDWIVMKAIEKDRTRRYESAGSLAADLNRFLRNEPVEARPPSRLYKLYKFSQRNKITLVTSSLVALALIAGTGVSIWQAARAVFERNQKEIALQQAIESRNEADQARKEIENFAERLKEANILVTSGRAHADAERWSDAYTAYTQAINRQPAYYNSWTERATLEVQLGLWKQAADDFRKAIELGLPEDNPVSWGIPQLFLFTGDDQSYRDYCLQMIRQAEAGAHSLSPPALRACVVGSAGEENPAELARLAEELIDHLPPRGPGGKDRPRFPPPGLDSPFPRPGDRRPDGQNDRPPPPGGRGPGMPHDIRPDRAEHGPPGLGRSADRVRYPLGVYYFIAGMAHYRNQEYEKSIERLRQAFDDRDWRGRPIAQFAMAMACHRTGQADEAHRWFEQGRKSIDHDLDEMLRRPVGKMSWPWFEWVEVLLVYREASLLLTGFVPEEDPRIHQMQRRALDAISTDDLKQ